MIKVLCEVYEVNLNNLLFVSENLSLGSLELLTMNPTATELKILNNHLENDLRRFKYQDSYVPM